MTEPDWIAVDWGTTHLRAWVMGAGGVVLAEAASDDGMAGLAPGTFEPALLRLISDWLSGPTDVVACGMVGSRQGWVEAPYRAVPCAPLGGALARARAADPRLRVHVVPGLKQERPADVMRGEETQIAGFLATHPGFDGILCLPGTHTKWAHVSAGEVVSFASFMTGEIFDLLAHRSVLRHSVAQGWDDAAFAEAVSDSLSRPERLAGQLFRLRAGDLLGQLSAAAARARLSGLLIGAELAAARPYWLGQEIALVGAERLMDLYSEALARQSCTPLRAEAKAMTLAGL
ncbi:MAG: 2-dehydro-3-deoxygalactonokinase, partial [Paracoccaceae bacterium]|nr:2-dehydro-3-deoxygalactonokinase [Paracoccaceae bacterium]